MATVAQRMERAKRQAIETVYKNAKDRITNRYRGFIPLVSVTVYRALVADEILHVLAAQDDSIEAETIRTLVNELHDMLNADKELN